MRVGRKVSRKVALDSSAMHRKRSQKLFAEAGALHGSIAKQVISPKPRQAAEGNLQAAGPVHPVRIRILAMPVFPLSEDFFGKLLLARDAIGLGQRQPALVPVQFPRNFYVAAFRKIEITNLVEHLSRRALAVHAIQAPVNFSAVIEIFIAEQFEVMLTDLLGAENNLVELVRKALLKS